MIVSTSAAICAAVLVVYFGKRFIDAEQLEWWYQSALPADSEALARELGIFVSDVHCATPSVMLAGKQFRIRRVWLQYSAKGLRGSLFETRLRVDKTRYVLAIDIEYPPGDGMGTFGIRVVDPSPAHLDKLGAGGVLFTEVMQRIPDRVIVEAWQSGAQACIVLDGMEESGADKSAKYTRELLDRP